MIKLNLN